MNEALEPLPPQGPSKGESECTDVMWIGSAGGQREATASREWIQPDEREKQTGRVGLQKDEAEVCRVNINADVGASKLLMS